MTKSTAGAGVLVVDDTLANLRLLTEMLSERGYDARPVTNGQEALRVAVHEPPELILLDVNMPGMSGYEVCEQLKNTPELREIPVIFLTALSDTANKLKGFSVGGADYITKPFHVDEVLARVGVHLALHRAKIELQQQYRRLCSLEQLRDDLVHMVVHDMRSPLSAMIITLELVLREAGPALNLQSIEDLRMAINATTGLSRMTNDLLDVSRLEDGKLPLQLAACDLVAVAHDVHAAVGHLDRNRVIEVTTADPVVVSCDRGIVQRVLENLVNNAIKYTPSEGRITVAIEPRDNVARVVVRDEGPGVPPDERSRIFEKFGTIAARKSGAFHSAGLGLAFCKLAVEAHGGNIGVDDAKPKGSMFWFELAR